jgi:hypothetical protein
MVHFCPFDRKDAKCNPSGFHTTVSIVFGLLLVFVELLAGLPGLGDRFVRFDSRNKTMLHLGLQDISSPGAGLNPTDLRDGLM